MSLTGQRDWHMRKQGGHDNRCFACNLPREQQAYTSNPQFRARYLEQLIALQMFAQMGEDEKLDETEEYQKILENAMHDILAQMAMAEALKGIEVSDDEAGERAERKVYKIAVEKTFLQETRNRFRQKGFKYFSLLERRCF